MSHAVIENVRHALGRTAASPLAPRPEVFLPRFADSPGAEIALFLNQVEALSGVGQQFAPADIAPALKALVAEQNIRKATMWDTPRMRSRGVADLLRALGVELVSPNADKHEMAQCDLGVTEADFVLPETGTIVLISSHEKPRGVSLLPRVHLAIISPFAFRADMHQVFTEAKKEHYMVFVTGPSRTSDIELTITLGVHGPRNLYAWVIQEFSRKPGDLNALDEQGR